VFSGSSDSGATVAALVAERQSTEDILALEPDLEADDVREAGLFAAEVVREPALPLAASERKFLIDNALRQRSLTFCNRPVMRQSTFAQ
jgi:hypothetical protein